jgi:hypothetical protein
MIKAEIIADSVSPTGDRITTYVLKFHRFILPEFNTHRQFSRNAASSRAIPVKKMLDQVTFDPAIPVKWGKNQPGMSAKEVLSPEEQEACLRSWLQARDYAVATVRSLSESVPLHKQTLNRLLEPWMWAHVVMTTTHHPSQLDNFFKQRTAGDQPQPEMLELATKMKEALANSTPNKIEYGDWHLPFITISDLVRSDVHPSHLKKISAARCARVSYLNHDGTKTDLDKDLELYQRLKTDWHMSPFEHQQTPASGWWANSFGWKQQRYFIEKGEDL